MEDKSRFKELVTRAMNEEVSKISQNDEKEDSGEEKGESNEEGEEKEEDGNEKEEEDGDENENEQIGLSKKVGLQSLVTSIAMALRK